MEPLTTAAVGSIATSAISAITQRLSNNAKSLASSNDIAGSKSLSQFTSDLHLRPRIAVERELINDEHIPTLINTATSSFASFYVLALSMGNTIQGITVKNMVGRFNPNRSTTNVATDLFGDVVTTVLNDTAGGLSTQSYDSYAGYGKVSTLGEERNNWEFKALPEKVSLSLQAHYPTLTTQANDIVETSDSVETPPPSNSMGAAKSSSDIAKEINDLGNLAVGKIITVNVGRDGVSAEVNMLLKPVLQGIGSTQLVTLSKGGTLFNSAERKKAMGRGMIESMWDYLTAADMWKAHRKRLVSDATGYYEEVHKKRSGRGMRALMSGQWGVGEIANTWIISQTTANRIEVSIRGKLEATRVRNKFMEEVGVMTLIIYSPEHQRIKIYNHGLDEVSEASMNYLVKKNASKDFDFDIFKLMSSGGGQIL